MEITVIVIAASLAMDAFAISAATGAANKNIRLVYTFKMAAFFGIFQAAMPLAGHLIGIGFASTIVSFDHWIAFGLLAAIGYKMIHDAQKQDKKELPNPAGLLILLTLSVATSIDALAIGITLNLITNHIFAAVTTIGIITFLLSAVGCRIGQKIGHIFENKIEIISGVVLITIGFKILLEHLLNGK